MLEFRATPYLFSSVNDPAPESLSYLNNPTMTVQSHHSFFPLFHNVVTCIFRCVYRTVHLPINIHHATCDCAGGIAESRYKSYQPFAGELVILQIQGETDKLSHSLLACSSCIAQYDLPYLPSSKIGTVVEGLNFLRSIPQRHAFGKSQL